MAVPQIDAAEFQRAFPALDLLWLHGSRARGEAGCASDWDVGYLGCVNDPLALHSALQVALGGDIDLVDLARANGLLRFRAAHEGRLLYERAEGNGEQFVLAALRYWYDAGPIIDREYQARLEDLVT